MRNLALLITFALIPHPTRCQPVRVAVAANLRYVMDDIKAAYAERHPGVTIEVTLGASGSLTQQILNGAQFDLFFSADRLFPDKLNAAGAVTGDVRTYAWGRLVLWSNVIDVSKGVNILTSGNVRRIAVAKPEAAPYGARAIQYLARSGLLDSVREKIVYAESISQAAQFARTGNAEAGFIALSLALAPDMKKTGNYFMPDTAACPPIEQAVVRVKTRQDNPEARKLLDFVLSSAARPIFGKYGYLVK